MSFKPDYRSCTALSGFGTLAVAGADAAAFLQAQTMNDVRPLAPGQWQWNGWLTPKGRVVALFALLRTAPDTFLLVLPDHPADALQAALQRFVFRSRVTLRPGGWTAATGPAEPSARGAVAAGDEAGGWAMDAGGDGAARTLWLVPDGMPVAPPSPAADAAWRAADIAHGFPRLGDAQREAWTPQMLSLDRLAAYSVKKGCYPGQEIVARTHFLGQAKRRLSRLAGAFTEGGTVTCEGRDVGTVVCTTDTGDEALAVLTADTGTGLATAGGPATVLPLNGGLQRVA